MHKTIINVFLIIGVLVIMFIAWQLIFTENGGVLVTTYNSLANSVNKVWSTSNGGTKDSIMPTWNTTVSVPLVEPSNLYEIYN